MRTGVKGFDEKLARISKPSCRNSSKLANRISANLFQKPALAFV